MINGILLPKLFWPTERKNFSSDWEKLLKFEAEGKEFPKFLRSLEQFIQTFKVQNNFFQKSRNDHQKSQIVQGNRNVPSEWIRSQCGLIEKEIFVIQNTQTHGGV